MSEDIFFYIYQIKFLTYLITRLLKPINES